MTPRRCRLAPAPVALAVSAALAGAPPAVALPAAAPPLPPELVGATPVALADLPGFAQDRAAAALTAFRLSCATARRPTDSHRGSRMPQALIATCARVTALPRTPGERAARAFFAANFTPYRVPGPAYVTGYFEPVVAGSLKRTAAFPVPLLAPPAGMVGGEPGQPNLLPDAGGHLHPMPDRAAIGAGALVGRARPLVWLHDTVDLFFTQVQGSARISLPNGTLRRVAFAARNNYPYTGIGKVLVQRLQLSPDKMGMEQLKQWIRANGDAADQAGGSLMNLNRSYIFFRFDDRLRSGDGPVGASGVSLSAMRSLAVDPKIWAFGLPFFIDAQQAAGDAGATPMLLQRVAIAQDTGAAIIGATRADLFTGTGPRAAALSGGLRARGTLYVLWPREEAAGRPHLH